jgi:hypothetical protein
VNSCWKQILGSWHPFFAAGPDPQENSIGNTACGLGPAAVSIALISAEATTALLQYLAMVSASFVLFSAVFKFKHAGQPVSHAIFVLSPNREAGLPHSSWPMASHRHWPFRILPRHCP